MTRDEFDNPVTPATLDFRAVAKVAQRIRLSEVRLQWSQLGIYTSLDEVDETNWARKAFLFYDSRAIVGLEPNKGQDARFLVQCIFQLRYSTGMDAQETNEAPETDEANPPDIAIEAVFDLSYAIDDWDDISEDDFQHFAFANGTHNAWPYWREFAQSMSLRLGLRPYVVGPFKLPSRDDPREPEPESETAATDPPAD